MELFGEMEREMKAKQEQFKLEVNGLNVSSGKIFRGENYKLFPYILLDYPRLFSADSVFAFRSMFWWGHEFSFTMHLQGHALDKFRKSILENIQNLTNREVYYCVNETPWQYYFNHDNYILIEDCIDLLENIRTKPFIKLSRKLPVNKFENVFVYCLDTYNLFFNMLKEH